MELLQTVYPFKDAVSEIMGFDLNMKSCIKNEKTMNAENKIYHASHCCSIIKKLVSINEEVIVDETLNGQNSLEQLSECCRTFKEDKRSNSEAVGACKEYNCSDSKPHKYLSKSATFPFSEDQTLHVFCAEINGASSDTIEPAQKGYADQFSTCMRSNSLPASFKLISAMKGGRAQNEVLPKIGMHVKWAEGVHDPPPTSMSHTVKSHNIQRPRPKKKDTGHKNSKGKYSRGNSSGKKLPSRATSGNFFSPFPAKLLSGGTNRPAPPDITAGAVHDAKCGNIFLSESLAKLHLSFGEAT